jgi:peptide/nickel transport system substrate-binding protein
MRSITRRRFVGGLGLAGLTPIVAACGQAAAPTAAPVKPAAEGAPAPKPAAAEPTKPLAVAPTTAPAIAPTVQSSAPAPAAKPTERAAKPQEARVGARLIGKLEGPEVVTDAAKFPKAFKEAPQLADLVKAGKLPPVAERIGQDPLVIKPVHEIGKYGGTWRRGFTGPGDQLNGIRAGGGADFILYVDYTGQKVVPNIAKGWEVSPDGRTTTIFLRRGMKWSDGQPFTADAFLFWFEDVYQNKELVPTPSSFMSINGKPGVVEKVDAYTVRYRFPDPYYLFPELLAFSSPISGQATNGADAMGGYLPGHYLKQFHPKYASKEDLDKKVAEAKVDNWRTLFKLRCTWQLNPELPVVSPWKTVTPNNTPLWTLERNPYSIWVDTDGNQLPYIDKIQLTLGENLEVVNLRAIAGEFDLQARHIDIGKVPVYLDNQTKGGYKLSINPMTSGSDYGIFFNQAYDADPELGKWFRTADFRRALSLGIDRDQINETFFLGIGTPGSGAPAETNKYSPGPEYRKLWSTYDLNKANDMLDKIGLDKKDPQGYRLRQDGKGRLGIEVTTLGGQFVQYTQISEMVREHWRKIGIDLRIQEVERTLAIKRGGANENQLLTWSNDGTDTLFVAPGWLFPLDGSSWYSPLYGTWFQSGGTQGKEPPPRMREVMEKWRKAFGVQEEERIQLGKEIWKIALDEVWYIGVAGQAGAVEGVQVAKVDLGNVPERFTNVNISWPPSISRPVTFFWKK